MLIAVLTVVCVKFIGVSSGLNRLLGFFGIQTTFGGEHPRNEQNNRFLNLESTLFSTCLDSPATTCE